MRNTGKIVSWKAEKGFGFIAPSTGGKDVFVHIKAFGGGSKSPTIGTQVSYVEATDAQGRIRAERVKVRGAGLELGSAAKAFIAASAFLSLVAVMVAIGMLPSLLLWLYLAVTALTFLVYAADKSAAEGGGWRTSESTLHLLSLLGGWPGAMYAQELLRHKTSKHSFRSTYWITVVMNVVALGCFIADDGAWLVDLVESIVR